MKVASDGTRSPDRDAPRRVQRITHLAWLTNINHRARVRPARMRRVATLMGVIGSSLGLTAEMRAQGADAVSPPHRRHHAVAYDPVHRRSLLFGGQHVDSGSNAPMLDDVWSWDGTRWTSVAASSGVPALAHRVFVDETGALVATGGPRGRTMRWEGQSWHVLAADSTSRREMATGAWDSDRHRFVLFGGHIDGRAFPADTREFDGRKWSQVTVEGPTPVLGGAMSYDEKRRVMVLFGGLDSAGRKRNETWEWDGKRWSRVSEHGPSARFGAGMAYDARRGESILFGGVDAENRKLNDTWRWNGVSWRRAEEGIAPAARSEGYLAFDRVRDRIVMFGGEGAQLPPTLGDTWEWDGTRWLKRG